jgi:hypothetical protein
MPFALCAVSDTEKFLNKNLNKAKKSLYKNFNKVADTFDEGLNYTHDTIFDKRSTAIHEAGHALLQMLFGIRYDKATIEFADKNYKKMSSLKAFKKNIKGQSVVGGYVTGGGRLNIFNDLPSQLSEQEKFDVMNYRKLQNCYISVVISLGGVVAEQIFGAYTDLVPYDLSKMITSDKQATGHKDILKITLNAHGQGDMKNIKSKLSQFFDKKEYNNVIVQCYTITYKILRTYKKELQQIADLLVKKRTVSDDAIYQLLQLHAPTNFEKGNMPVDVYADEFVRNYATTQEHIAHRYLISEEQQDAHYYVITPVSSLYPNLTGLKIKIPTIYSNEYLQNRKLLTKK